MAAGLSGLAVAALIWRFALALGPDARGGAVVALSLGRRRAALFTTVAGGALSAAVVAAVLPEHPATVALALFAAVSPGLAVIDAVAHRLPYLVTGAIAGASAIFFGWDAAWSGSSAPLTRAGWAALVVGTAALVWWWIWEGGFALGDVVLLAVIGGFAGWLSWAAVWTAIAAGACLAALALGMARWRSGKGGPYHPQGPWYLAGWWAVFALYAIGWIGQPT